MWSRSGWSRRPRGVPVPDAGDESVTPVERARRTVSTQFGSSVGVQRQTQVEDVAGHVGGAAPGGVGVGTQPHQSLGRRTPRTGGRRPLPRAGRRRQRAAVHESPHSTELGPGDCGHTPTIHYWKRFDERCAWVSTRRRRRARFDRTHPPTRNRNDVSNWLSQQHRGHAVRVRPVAAAHRPD